MNDKKKENIRKEQLAEENEFNLLWENATPIKVEVGKNTSVVISVRMSDAALDGATKAADHLEISLNKFIRTAIEEKVASLGMLSRLGLTSLIKSLTEQLTQMNSVVVHFSDSGSQPETSSADEETEWKISGTDKIIHQPA